MIDWDKYRRNGMTNARTIDLCKAFDDLYPNAPSTKRAVAYARLLECERLHEIGSRQVAASVLSGVAYTLGLDGDPASPSTGSHKQISTKEKS